MPIAESMTNTRAESVMRPQLGLGAVVAVLLVALAAYWPSVQVFYDAWTDFHNIGATHGFLVAAAAVCLLIRDRNRFATSAMRPSLLAAGLAFAASVAWLICYRAAVEDLHVTILPLLVGLGVAAILGWQAAWRLVIPLGLICCALPSWGHLSDPLQTLTVGVVSASMSLTGLPGHAVGNVIRIPYGTVAIEGGCSGLHYLVVGVAVALFYGELRRDSIKIRVFLAALMIALALITNWLRVYWIIYVGLLTGMRTSLITHGHYWFGWELFLGALAIFFWLAGKPFLSSPDGPPAPLGGGVGEPALSAARLVPVSAASRVVGGVALGLAALIAAPLLTYATDAALHTSRPLRVELVAMPPASGWSGPRQPANSAWRPQFPGADGVATGVYQHEGAGSVEVFSAAYSQQRQGVELIGWGSVIADEQVFRVLDSSRIDVDGAGFNELRMADRTGTESVVWSYYTIGTRRRLIPLAAQLTYGATSILATPLSSVVALRALCAPDCAAARQLLRTLVAQVPLGPDAKPLSLIRFVEYSP